MKRSFLLRFRIPALLGVLAAAGVSSVVACGGISDPNKSSANEPVATVSGALTGTAVPANAHVALVWRIPTVDNSSASPPSTPSSPSSTPAPRWVVSNDVAVVGGQFTMNLTVPADNLFALAESSSYEALSGGSAPPSSSSTEPSSSSGSSAAVDASAGPSASSSSSSGASGALPSFDFAHANIHPKDQVSGSITQPLRVAVAGFIVYVDSNGNNKLDLEGAYASSPDQIIGGNKELMLAYLKDGGALDYEKLRDRSGILPTAGYNLAWNEGRWLPLNVVELKLSSTTKLPSALCSNVDEAVAPTTDFGGGTGGALPTGTDAGAYGNYPPKGDPKLHCSPDGYSWTYDGGWGECPTQPPPPTGLCVSGYATSAYPCAKISGGSLDPWASPVPQNWPCDIVVGSIDGGTGWDASADDAGAPGVDSGI